MTGVDALAHAIECYTMKFAQPITDAVALLAIEYGAHYIRRAFADGEDLEARYGMAQAAMLAGLSYGSESAGAAHAMSQTLGGIIPVAHGQCVAAMMGPVMEYNWNAPADFIFSNISALSRSALVGMHPSFKHVPPREPSSIRMTSLLFLAAVIAAT